MVVCRYFQQGNCRFGNNCRFEHPRTDYGAVVSPLLRSGSHQPPPNQHAPGPFGPPRSGVGNIATDVRELFNIMQQEIDLAERGSQWPLSCFNPMPSRCPGVVVPGLEDHSPEELRCLLYEARAVNSVDSCNQHIQQLYQQANMKRSSLKVPSPETFSLISTMLRSPRQSSQQSIAQDAWPVPSAATQGTSHGQMSIFGAASPPQQSPVFGGASQASVFAGTQQQSIFGGGATLPQTNIFSAASPQAPQPAQAPQQMSVFGGPSQFGGTNQSSFAQTAPFPGNAQQGSLFGGQHQTPFTGSNNQGSIFGGAALPPSNSFTFALPNQFGSTGTVQPAAQAPFGASTVQPPAQAPFGGQGIPSQSIFGGSASQPAVGGGGMGFDGFQTSQGSQNTSIFGKAPAGASGSFGSSSSSDTSLHTPLAELSEQEKEEFSASKFTSGCIPVRPPPKEFCS